VSDEQAAKIIADKIRGTPNLNIQNIKMYVTKYLGMVGKAPTDVDFIAAHVNDILSAQGMSESEESAEQRKSRVARGWELNKRRWDKWKKENPEKAKLNARRKAGIYSKEENSEDTSYEDNKQRLKEEIYYASETLGSVGKAIQLAKEKKWNLNFGIPDEKWDDIEADIEADMDNNAYDYEPGDGHDEDAEMPTKQFMNLKQFINKGPIQVKKPSKELPYTHNYIRDLAKQDSREEHKEEGEEDNSTALIDREPVYSLGNGYSILVNKKREEDRHSFDINVLKDIDPKNNKYEYITQIYRLGEIALNIKNWADTKDPVLQQKAIDALRKYEVTLPAVKNKEENEERRLDPKCWKGYHKQGTKLKGGKRVNNCVKNK
jgi:hypothetical protein